VIHKSGVIVLENTLNHCYLGRHNTYYFRYRIPARILKLFPDVKKEFRKSLNTGYQAIAHKKSTQLYLKVTTFCDQLHNSVMSSVLIINKININEQIHKVISMHSNFSKRPCIELY